MPTPKSQLPEIHGRIGGFDVSREQVRAWEARRLQAALRRHGLPETGDVETQKAALLARRLEIGLAGTRAALRLELRVGDIVGATLARLSGGRRRTSVCELWASRGSAEVFATWFMRQATAETPSALLAACPDHHAFGVDPRGRQIVIETTGGSPAATEFYIGYDRDDGLRTPIDPAYPVQVAGVAYSAGGVLLGGVRHQFRSEGSGFHAKLTVEFPALMPAHPCKAHRWHLACEFANWIELAAQADAD